jgi:hypothetical protein
MWPVPGAGLVHRVSGPVPGLLRRATAEAVLGFGLGHTT